MDRRQRKRTVAIGLAFIAVAGLVVSTFGDRWLVSPDREDALGLGLRGVELCKDSSCKSMTNFDAIDYLEREIQRVIDYNATVPPQKMLPVPRSPWHGFPVVGWIVFVSALTAAAGLLVGAMIALAGKRVELPIMPTTIAVIALGVYIIDGALYTATKPALLDVMTVGWTFIAFGVGGIAGLASVFPLNRQIRPIDPELGAAAATVSWGVSRDDQ